VPMVAGLQKILQEWVTLHPTADTKAPLVAQPNRANTTAARRSSDGPSGGVRRAASGAALRTDSATRSPRRS